MIQPRIPREAAKVPIAVTLEGHHGSRSQTRDRTARYDFVLKAGLWEIDDIRGAVDGQPWPICSLLTDSLKY